MTSYILIAEQRVHVQICFMPIVPFLRPVIGDNILVFHFSYYSFSLKKMNAINANTYISFNVCMNNVQVVSIKRILWHINNCIFRKSLEGIAVFLVCDIFKVVRNLDCLICKMFRVGVIVDLFR